MSSISAHSRLALIVAVLLVLTASASAETRAEVIAARDQAVTRHAGAEQMWAAVEARVSRPEPPTMDDLMRAHLLAEAAVRLAPGEPWGYLARLAIARRWDDPELIARRLDELTRVTPGDPRTLQAVAELRPQRSVGVVLGWCALTFLIVATLAHALCRRLGPRTRARTALVATMLLLVPGSALAFPIDDADPERHVPTQAEADARPLDFAYYVQDLIDRAAAARQRGDHAAAARYYRALARAVPDSSVPERLLRDAELAAPPAPRPTPPTRSSFPLIAAGIGLALVGVVLLAWARRRQWTTTISGSA